MRRRLWGLPAAVLVAVAVVVAVFCLPAVAAAATYLSPHGSFPTTISPGSAPGFAQDTELCALCHWTHGAPAPALGRSEQVPLCFTCHGAAGQGSNFAVEQDFAKASRHSLDPSPAAFGPDPKECSDCHNPHGDREASGAYYAKLLRSKDSTDPVYSTGTYFFAGSAYCGACHEAAPGAYAVSTDLYEATPHFTGLSDPPSGTKVRCLVCHEQHGSDVAPLLAAAVNEATVTANDRSQCYACHPSALRSYDGSATYDGSAHGLAEGTLFGRPVSACQQCHDPHGARDLDGLIPRLNRRLEESVCFTCHDANGPAADDLYSRLPTAGAAPRYEVALSITPTEHAGAGADRRLGVLSQETAGAAPRPLRGPYETPIPAGVRSLAVGDIDGDGRDEALVGERDAQALIIVHQSPLSGLVATQSVGVVLPADDLAIGDVTADGKAEAVFVSRFEGELAVYGWSGATLSLVNTYTTGGAEPCAVALGDVNGDGLLDAVTANAGSDNIGWLRQVSGGMFAGAVTFASEASPTGVAIADLDGDAAAEVVVANSGADSVRVFTYSAGTLSLVGTYATTSSAAASPRDVATGGLLAGYPGREVVVSLSHDTSQSGLNVFSSASGGALTFRQEATTGVGARTHDVAVADVDGDGEVEAVAGNAGTFLGAAPGVGVFKAASPTSLGFQEATPMGASQDGGGIARLAIGNLGSLYPYRHNFTAVQRSHESTEVTIAAGARHVECADCHNSMVADTSTASAPLVLGALRGAYGVAVTNGAAGAPPAYAPAQPAAREYEVCFKCHSGLAGESGRRDLATLLNPANASYHPVEAAGTNTTIAAGAWANGWDASSRVYCSDCHTESDTAAPLGPHASSWPRILAGPYIGAAPAASGACWGCHRFGAYYDGDESTATPASRFYDGRYTTPQLHSYHLKTQRLDCRACHVQHGSATERHLLRSDVGFSHDSTGGANGGGSCSAAGCHAATRYYQALYP